MCDLLEDLILQGLIASEDQDVRGDTHSLKFLDGVLGGL